ncbi:MAG: stage II sporulation protein D [Clostridia bacterium]
MCDSIFYSPAICTATPCTVTPKEIQETVAVQNEKEESSDGDTQNYEDSKTIKLLHSETGQIEEINLEEYLYGVVSSEMPANFEIEALKAQAVVARTYTIYQINNNSSKHENADICDNYACCQAWISKEDRISKWNEEEAESNWNKIVEAVNSTSGKVITYDGKPINAFFHSNSGGVTESSTAVWGGIDFPYLKSVETAGEEGYKQYSSQVQFSKQELLNKIKEKYQDCEIDFSQQNCIEILEYTTSGRVKTIKFGNKEIAGTEARHNIRIKVHKFHVFNKRRNSNIFCNRIWTWSWNESNRSRCFS